MKKIKELYVDKVDNSNFEFNNYFSSFWSFGEKVFETKYGTIKYDKNKIYIPNSLMKKIITNQVDKIINHIKKLLKEFNKIKIDFCINWRIFKFITLYLNYFIH